MGVWSYAHIRIEGYCFMRMGAWPTLPPQFFSPFQLPTLPHSLTLCNLCHLCNSPIFWATLKTRYVQSGILHGLPTPKSPSCNTHGNTGKVAV